MHDGVDPPVDQPVLGLEPGYPEGARGVVPPAAPVGPAEPAQLGVLARRVPFAAPLGARHPEQVRYVPAIPGENRGGFGEPQRSGGTFRGIVLRPEVVEGQKLPATRDRSEYVRITFSCGSSVEKILNVKDGSPSANCPGTLILRETSSKTNSRNARRGAAL